MGQAVVKVAEEKGLAVRDPQQFEALPGLGVRVTTEENTIQLGRARFMADQGLQLPGGSDKQAALLAGPGRTSRTGRRRQACSYSTTPCDENQPGL